MFSILANIIIVFGLFGMLVATWMLVKGAKKAVQFAGVTHQKNRKIRPKKPNYFVRWWNHLKSLYEEDMRKQRMLKRSLPEVQVTEVNPTPTSGAEFAEETIVTKTTEDTPVSEAVSEEVVVTTIDEADTEEEAITKKVVAETTEETVSEVLEPEVLEPEVLEPETKTSKKRSRK